MSKISVITPIYNHGQYIRFLYDRMMEQTEKDWDWTIINDGSTDDTVEKVRELPKNNKIRIEYKSKSRRGIAPITNLGISLSTSKYITVIPADDYPLPKYLETYSKTLGDRKLDFVMGRHYSLSGESMSDESDVVARNRKHSGIGQLSSASMWIRETFGDKPFNANFSAYLDLGFWYEILSKDYKIGWIKEPLYVYRNGSSTISVCTTKRERAGGRCRVRDVYEDRLDIIKKNCDKFWDKEVVNYKGKPL